MIRFNNDYNHGALDSIQSALPAANAESFPGYGEDIWCDEAKELIKKDVKVRHSPFFLRIEHFLHIRI